MGDLWNPFSTQSSALSPHYCFEEEDFPWRQLFPRHGRASLFGNVDHKPSPVQTLAYKHGSILVRSGFSEEKLQPVGVNPTRSPDWSFELNVIFPCSFVAVSEGTYFTHQFLPVSVDKTLWESTTYYPKAHSPAQRFSQAYSRIIFRDIFLEDGRTIEETQAMLSSGAKKELYLKDEELLIRHSLHAVQQMIDAAE